MGSANGGRTPLRRPPLAGSTPRMIPVNPISLCYHCAKTLSLCCIVLCLFSLTFTVFQFVSWTALLYICQKHRVTLGRGIETPRLRVWARPMGDAITSPPIGWSRTQNDPCWPYISLCKTSLSCWILLCSATITVFQCVSWTALL